MYTKITKFKKRQLQSQNCQNKAKHYTVYWFISKKYEIHETHAYPTKKVP